MNIHWLKMTDSTNLDAWRNKDAAEDMTVWCAEYQTAGRGQRGNRWESRQGENLMFSILFRPRGLRAAGQFVISQICSVGIVRYLAELGLDARIKWPNDIYIGDRKICGMLIENDLAGQFIYSSILGIGININQKEFKSNAPNPVSLYQIIGKRTDRENFLQEFLERLYANYLLLLQEKEVLIQEAYRQSLYRREGFHLYEDANGRFEASIEEIEPSGYLHLRLRDNTIRRYEFKEVRFVISS